MQIIGKTGNKMGRDHYICVERLRYAMRRVENEIDPGVVQSALLTMEYKMYRMHLGNELVWQGDACCGSDAAIKAWRRVLERRWKIGAGEIRRVHQGRSDTARGA